MTTAIIGVGGIGTAVARALAAAGEPLLLAAGTQEHASDLASALGADVEAAPVAEAIERADTVVLAVWFDTIRELFEQHADGFRDTVVVDPSNPIAPDGSGGFVKTLPAESSSGVVLRGILPDGARLAKAFGTLSAPTLASVTSSGHPVVGFYAADDDIAGDEAARLLRLAGLDPVRVGGIDQSIRIEVFGDLHEFGALGRTVSAEEAAALV